MTANEYEILLAEKDALVVELKAQLNDAYEELTDARNTIALALDDAEHGQRVACSECSDRWAAVIITLRKQ